MDGARTAPKWRRRSTSGGGRFLTVQRSAQHGPLGLKVAVHAARGHDARRRVERCKVALEGDGAARHGAARAERLEGAAAAVRPARLVAKEREVCRIAAAGAAWLHRVQ